MPRKEQGWITFQTSEEERKALEDFCQQSQRTKTEILRELVRGLGKNSVPLPSEEETDVQKQKPLTAKTKTQKMTDEGVFEEEVLPEVEVGIGKKPLKVSSRNVLKGVVTQIVRGPVNSEVTLEVVHRVKLTSVITQVSAAELELAVGEEAYAVIKSTDIAIAVE
jgi:molybdopterin-binding protein